MDCYSTTTFYEGHSCFENVYVGSKLESVSFKQPCNFISNVGMDGSYTSGNSFISVGIKKEGLWIVDASIPTGLHSRYGTTFYYNPSNLEYIANQTMDAIDYAFEHAHEHSLHPFPLPIPLPIPY